MYNRMKKGTQKTLYLDIDTEVRLVKMAKKGKVSQSKVVKTLIHKTPFDKMVELLNEELKA